MIRRLVLAAVATAALACAGACSGPAQQPAPTTASQATSAAPTSTTDALPACSNLFETGQLVKPELADVKCTDPTGLSVNHKVVCKDGRVMVFDSALKVYGFPGGVFAAMDTAADSAYAADYRKCLSGR